MSAHRLWIDAQAVQSPHFERGIPRYVTAVIHALDRRGVTLAGIGLNPSQALPAEPHRSLLSLPATTWATAERFGAALAEGPLTYLQSSPFEGFRPSQNLWPPFVLASGVPLVTIVYDTIPFRDPEYRVTPQERAFHEARGALVRQADLVLAISEATERDIVDDLGIDPARVAVIGSGVSVDFRPAADRAVPAARLAQRLPGLRPPFVFSVCGWTDRKNTDGLIAAWRDVPAATRRDHQLVITCAVRPDALARWERQIDDLGLRGQVLLTGAVADDVLLALYQTASLFVYPSRYEGFGLPIAEAVECGCPAISSHTSSMPEVIGWMPGLFDPDDRGSIAASIEQGLTDTRFRAELEAACAAARGKHTWDSVAARLVEALDRLPVRSLPTRRRRVALLGAHGDHLLHLGGAIAAHVDVDCFVSGPRPSSTQAHVQVFPISAFGTALEPAAYDERFYTLDDTPLSVAVLRHALRHPGVVHLATTSLAALYVALALDTPDPPAAMLGHLRDVYGERLPERARRGWELDVHALTEVGVHCTAAVARVARHVVVGSAADARIVALDVGPLAPAVPITVGEPDDVLPGLLGLDG